MIRAYVSIRGSRSPRRVKRDADLVQGEIRTQIHMWPIAALTLIPEQGRPITYELSYLPPPPNGTQVTVQLLLRMPDAADDRQLWQGVVNL